MQLRRPGEYILAAAIAGIAIAISPIGIEFFTGRADLTFRVTCVSLVLASLLLAMSAAMAAGPRTRPLFFAVAAMLLPFAALAGLETTAIALHLADRVAPLEDISIIEQPGRYPGYLFSIGRWQPDRRLYRPWQGAGISINADGLRTRLPSQKAPAEWRVAITGGSAVWGWRVLDQDTIPVHLQESVGNAGLTFFNFGIEGFTVAQELALLKQFRERYGIDQAIFYTGANDAFSAYLDLAGSRKRLFDAVDGVGSFELFKAATRWTRIMANPSSAAELERLQNELILRVDHGNRLREGLQAAEAYCNEVGLRCDFVLQPLLLTRMSPVGPELRLLRAYRDLYPGFAQMTAVMYKDAVAAVPRGRIHDLSNIFDAVAHPVFTDSVHVNQLGNRIAAERIAKTISFGPRSADDEVH
jgi:hypothetical protein